MGCKKHQTIYILGLLFTHVQMMCSEQIQYELSIDYNTLNNFFLTMQEIDNFYNPESSLQVYHSVWKFSLHQSEDGAVASL